MRDRGAIPIIAVERLTRRSDFRAASTGDRVSVKAFVLQALRRAQDGPARVGFTVSRQVGNAVVRNRVRRRLREMIRLNAGGEMRAGHDYVLIGRRVALALPFSELRQELDAALSRIHHPERAVSSGRGGTGVARQRPLHEGSPRPKSRRQPRKA